MGANGVVRQNSGVRAADQLLDLASAMPGDVISLGFGMASQRSRPVVHVFGIASHVVYLTEYSDSALACLRKCLTAVDELLFRAAGVWKDERLHGSNRLVKLFLPRFFAQGLGENVKPSAESRKFSVARIDDA